MRSRLAIYTSESHDALAWKLANCMRCLFSTLKPHRLTSLAINHWLVVPGICTGQSSFANALLSVSLIDTALTLDLLDILKIIEEPRGCVVIESTVK